METPDHGQNIITRGLPKTGQTIQHSFWDDGLYEAGWWVGRLNANNRERWIAKTIGGDDIVVDRATGLMWAADGNAAGCGNGLTFTWVNALGEAKLLDFAGFSNWRLPNMFELVSILRLEGPPPLIEQPPFSNTKSSMYWSSTTAPSSVLNAFPINFGNGAVIIRAKAEAWYIRAVRGGM